MMNKAVKILLPLAGGLVIGKLTANAQKDYKKLEQPPLSPPAVVFPIVWPALYLGMGVAYDKASSKSDDLKIPVWHYTQLGFNYAWSILYFKYRKRGMALIDSVLLVASAAAAGHFMNDADKKAGSLMIPYIGWLTYATYLNAGSWWLNKK